VVTQTQAVTEVAGDGGKVGGRDDSAVEWREGTGDLKSRTVQHLRVHGLSKR
jgi:hypothetical protein